MGREGPRRAAPGAVRALGVVALLAALLVVSQALAESNDKRGLFTDPEDGALDASEWLLEKKGFLPVPTIITEPAVGKSPKKDFIVAVCRPPTAAKIRPKL